MLRSRAATTQLPLLSATLRKGLITNDFMSQKQEQFKVLSCHTVSSRTEGLKYPGVAATHNSLTLPEIQTQMLMEMLMETGRGFLQVS